jgi:hypothetical protein
MRLCMDALVKDILTQAIAEQSLRDMAFLHGDDFFGGVREEGSVASPGSSSSDQPRRNPNQETVA